MFIYLNSLYQLLCNSISVLYIKISLYFMSGGIFHISKTKLVIMSYTTDCHYNCKEVKAEVYSLI